MNRNEALKAMIDGEGCSHAPSKIKYRFNIGKFQRKLIGEIWEDYNINTIGDDDNYEIHTEAREFTIKPTDWVLVRDESGDDRWLLRHYSGVNTGYHTCPFTTTCGSAYKQIAPYAGNESKLNTTDDIADKFTKDDL